MSDKSVFQQHPKKTLAVVVVAALALTLGLAEILLSVIFPMNISAAGFMRTENGFKYGWGYNPNQLVRTEDPDTGEVYLDRVNSHGWRDRDRTFENPSNAYRILVFGDSVSFGFVIPAEKIFTRALEGNLRSNGFNAEVLNISYSGWGTHQQFEALKHEGVRYKPDLVIFHTSPNDLGENLNYTVEGKTGRRVPFFYDFDGNHRLTRSAVPAFQREHDAITRKLIISKSQILIRLWLLRGAWKVWSQPRHVIDESRLFQLEHCLSSPGKEAFLKEIAGFVGEPVTADEISAAAKKHELGAEIERALQLTENRHFQAVFRF